MKKGRTLLVLLATLFLNTGYANEEKQHELNKKTYFSINAGTSISRKIENFKFHKGYYVGAAIGYKLSDFRFELDSSFQRFLEKKTNHTYVVRGGKGFKEIISLITNVYYDFDVDFPLRPYIGGGLGYYQSRGHTQWRRLDTFLSSRLLFKNKGIVWQAMAGVKYSLCRNTELGIEYRLLQQEKYPVVQRVGLSLTRYF